MSKESNKVDAYYKKQVSLLPKLSPTRARDSALITTEEYCRKLMVSNGKCKNWEKVKEYKRLLELIRSYQ